MHSPTSDLLSAVASYYTKKLAEHGPTPRGVDWNGEDSQALRFEQLCRIITTPGHFSINDIGCGYGALLDFVAARHRAFSYTGVDISAEMIRAATKGHPGAPNARFIHADQPDDVADYGIASGILNVRLNQSDDEWRGYLEGVLDLLDRTSTRGFAFNCLTSYSDADRMRIDLYYADPCALFDLCKRRYSRQVALLHDYGLYEFTILVRKQR
jgi:SAM-dependent methyltransferase